MKKLREKYLGCLFGLAIGDALGAPVEFLILSQIRREYGGKRYYRFPGIPGLQPRYLYRRHPDGSGDCPGLHRI
jgi:ADP-ribosylglycohydrolase